MAQVHVHLREAGAAIEAALGEGRLSQIRITALPPEPPAQTTERTVICVVAGPGLADAVSALGGTPVLAADRDHTLVELTAAAEHGGGDLIILPNDPGTLGRAGAARVGPTGAGPAGDRHPHRRPGPGSGRDGGA